MTEFQGWISIALLTSLAITEAISVIRYEIEFYRHRKRDAQKAR